MNSLPSKSVSDNLLNAIGKALEEEKQPRWKRILKVVLWTIGVSSISLLPFIGIIDFTANTWSVLTCVFWVLLLGVGFFLYFKPQPRLAVPGYLSAWVYAKIIIGATIGTIATFLVCPSFSFIPTTINWNPLEHFTMHLMSIGGMVLCMLFCGFMFSIIISSIAFSSMAKVLLRTRMRQLKLPLAIVLLAQLPIISFQVFNPGLRSTVAHWILGSAVGALIAIQVIKNIAGLIEKRTARE